MRAGGQYESANPFLPGALVCNSPRCSGRLETKSFDRPVWRDNSDVPIVRVVEDVMKDYMLPRIEAQFKAIDVAWIRARMGRPPGHVLSPIELLLRLRILLYVRRGILGGASCRRKPIWRPSCCSGPIQRRAPGPLGIPGQCCRELNNPWIKFDRRNVCRVRQAHCPKPRDIPEQPRNGNMLGVGKSADCHADCSDYRWAQAAESLTRATPVSTPTLNVTKRNQKRMKYCLIVIGLLRVVSRT